MELCGSRRKLGLFVVYIAYLSGYFNTVSAGDVCGCQPYGCNTCPSSAPCTRENVALGKPASTSSLFNNSHWRETSGPACLAVNGNTDTVFKPINTNPSDPACVHTADGDYTPYWEVDLKKEYVISSITVYGRSPPDKNKLKNAKVAIDGNLCYSYETDNTQSVIMNISCSSSLTGRRVKIYSNQEFLTVCQVQVWGYYGPDCLSTGGNCSNGTCDPSSGVCVQGCDAGYQLPYCEETVIVSGPDKTPVIAGVVVGCGVALVIVLVILDVLLLRRRRTRKSRPGSDTETRTDRQHNKDNGMLSASASLPSSQKPAAEWRKKTEKEKPSIAVKPTVLKKPTGDAADVKGVTSENVYVNATSEASGDLQADDGISSADILPGLEDESDHTYRNDENTYATFMASRPQLDSVQQSLIGLLGSGILAEQFEELPKGLTDVHEAAKLPFNIKKNRYYSVLPYDKNRVVLTDGFSEGKAADFVNASYITGFQRERTYIAAQGPRDNTAADFWRMVWQEDITQIIMLTGLVENGKDKCFEYWPARDKTETYGPVTVTGVDVQRRENFFIRSFVIKMRGDQYIFLHKAVPEAYTAKDTNIANDQFVTIFPQPVKAGKENSRIDKEFKRAMQMRSLTPAMPVTMATEESNKTKIRNMTFLPADEHLVYLTAYAPGRDQFINAVYLSTYREYNGSILTQLPLEKTLVDFWLLVDGCHVKAIVSLGDENEHETVQDFCQFWPKDAGVSLSADPYIIRHKATSPLGSQLTLYTLNPEKKKVPGFRQVQLLHYKTWAGELPENTTDLLALIDKIDSLCLGQNNPLPVIIQCQDGVTRSGLFAALWNVLSRLASDKEVDVYMAVREVHSVRPQAVTSLEQYRYCYEVAQKRVTEMNVYTSS